MLTIFRSRERSKTVVRPGSLWFMDRPLLIPVSTGWNATSHESRQVGSVDGWRFLAVLHRYKPNFAFPSDPSDPSDIDTQFQR